MKIDSEYDGRFLPLILLLFSMIAISYSVVNPLFEAPDEHWHYFTAQYIADTGKLPSVEGEYDEWLSQEAAQPPLYYLFGAILIAPIDASGAKEKIWLNPYAWIGNAAALANVNRMVHTPVEAWPWHGFALAAHLLRGMSILFGLGTLLCVYASGRLLWPSDPQKSYLAVALTGFLPQFDFIHSAISNDSLIIFLCSAAIWQLLRLWLNQVSWQRLLILSVTIGLAALTKNAGILLLLYAIGFLLFLAIRDNHYRLIWQTAVLVVLPVFLIAGWLWWRNWNLYSDFTAANQFIRIAGGDRRYTLLQVLGETRGLWTSFFAIFGWFNVRAPEWVYWIWNGLVVVAFIGLLTWVWANRHQIFNCGIWHGLLKKRGFLVILLGIWPIFVYTGLLQFMLRTEAAQGRLLFPALLPLMLGLAYGLTRFRWTAVPWVASLLALATTIYSLFCVIGPTYRQPATIDMLPTNVTHIDQKMGQGLTLLGAKTETTTAVPGDTVQFTLYWQAETIPVDPPEFVLELFGRESIRVGNLHSYHGRGLFPANLWPEGKIIADRFAVRLDDSMGAPVLAWVQARIAGEETVARIGSVKVTPESWPEPKGKSLAQLGQGIELTAIAVSPTTANPGDTIELTVQWLVTTAPQKELTTLVHLGDSGQPPFSTGDSPPLQGEYPTGIWDEGEIINDSYFLEIPDDLEDGRYPILLGMYDPITGGRLPLLINDTPQANEIFLAGWISVKK